MLENPDEPRPPKRNTTAVAFGMVVLFVVAVGALLYYYRRPAPPAPAVAEKAAAPSAPAPSPPPGPPPVLDAARLKALLEAVSANPAFRSWAAQGDVVRRWVVVTDNLAEGVSPRRQLGFLALARPFAVVTHGKTTAIAPASYRRFDEFADAVASVDAKALAAAYREAHAVLEAAYRELGYPGASFDRVTARALVRIASVPVPDGDLRVEGDPGGPYAFADPRLEVLGPVEKQILRMGPENERKLQAKAREILDALALPGAEPPKRRP
ncbi:MAG TPA: DUF3014 domain-containing protein [Anaeromyxobacteraceae bacterium]|nr:DUF3014 domain-containing protein [Anaeromyxobacteraceae bacterium]